MPICVHVETEAAARSPTRKRVPGRTWRYVEEVIAKHPVRTTKVYVAKHPRGIAKHPGRT